MEESTSKEKVLKRVRNALISKSNNPFPGVNFEAPLYNVESESPDVKFAEEFTKLGGKFVYCESEDDLHEKFRMFLSRLENEQIHCIEDSISDLLRKLEINYSSEEGSLEKMTIGITGCEYLVARLGGIMVSSRQASGRRMFVYPDTHIVVAYASQLVPDIKDALVKIKQRYPAKEFPSAVTLITGPSRTADIEKTLVLGAHGPRNLYLFFVDDKNETV